MKNLWSSRGTRYLALWLLGLHLWLVNFQNCFPAELLLEGKNKSVVFRSGDAVRITVLQIRQSSERNWTNLDLANDYPIDSNGDISMPIIGKIKVAGHTTEGLIELLKTQYSPYLEDPFITVIPLIRVTMQGAFNRPGAYRIDPKSSLWELVEMAGGPRENCALNKMWVERGGKIVNKKLLASFEKGYSLEDIGIESGDQILAPARGGFGLRDILDYINFGMSAVVLYLQIQRLNK